ncbi:iron dependent repressor, metal binding and dimerization domain protein [Thermoanaerobacterium thermosaccharolyticum]|uniref:iron dependent repressor, metal binding and dimerization domain protein n=1 Tax=Thermoanaerobacterium thermosaccharolyticum TaxID=1517 RepID=UPI003DA8CA7B
MGDFFQAFVKDTGKAIGKNLIKRHNTIIEFLKTLGIDENHLLEETEKIEHTISENTLQCFTNFIEFLKANKDVKKRLSEYISSKK